MKTTVYNLAGEKISELELDSNIFGLKIKPELIQRVAVVQSANHRDPVAHTKGRSEVRGGGKKPWKQKGTGRARHGSIRSPLWIGGGITFGPTSERNFSLKINKKAKRKALLMSLSDRAQNEKIILIDKIDFDKPKTKAAFTALQKLQLRVKKEKKAEKSKSKSKAEAPKRKRDKKILLVLPSRNEIVIKSFRNIERLQIINANSLNVIDVLKNEYLLMPVQSLDVIKKTYINQE